MESCYGDATRTGATTGCCNMRARLCGSEQVEDWCVRKLGSQVSLNSSCFSCGNGDKSYRMAGAPSARQTLSICAGEDIGVFTIQSNQIQRVANFIKAGVQSVENHRWTGLQLQNLGLQRHNSKCGLQRLCGATATRGSHRLDRPVRLCYFETTVSGLNTVRQFCRPLFAVATLPSSAASLIEEQPIARLVLWLRQFGTTCICTLPA